VCTHIHQLESYRYAKRIALYHPIGGEIDLSEIWRSALVHGQSCYFPTVNDDLTLSFLPATPCSAFVNNRFGISEPTLGKEPSLQPEQLDVMFIPLVAFDPRGTRLGRGAGYYDRTLSYGRPSLLVGVAYEFQRQPYIPSEPWDIPLDVMITERTTYWST
jgi:5-formyltetrahydrofolate cyclo-ligase